MTGISARLCQFDTCKDSIIDKYICDGGREGRNLDKIFEWYYSSTDYLLHSVPYLEVACENFLGRSEHFLPHLILTF